LGSSSATDGELKVYVNVAVALAVPEAARTASAVSSVTGMTTSAVKYPDALVLKATAVVPAVMVPGLFLGKPVPVTVTDVPAGPVSGLSVMLAVAACAGAATQTVPPASKARTETSVLSSFIFPSIGSGSSRT